MPESNTKAWYQDGFIVLVVVGVVALVLFAWLNPKKEFIELQTDGFLTDDDLVISCWHIFPGTLEKGRISVMLEGPSIVNEKHIEHHSFDTWPPNEENVLRFKFPLNPSQQGQPITVRYAIVASNARDTHYRSEWTGKTWSKPFVDVSVR